MNLLWSNSIITKTA